ncbi:hypothetical protein HYPSUDRAFT_32921 [Hypholoma sublateritium FD-334 SS-4]|uniref:Uncharacterized protein n=1 Tax=Hypholoma sublateritium (strain FD-334 SS-4) TaxID=945553 RepID=A0A0D2QCV0_HYPSF|nr:hypothetical protein HYPSUDRAFT_32921 [Hypholoma sublateritium FD-334 SS-4]
MSIEKLNTPKNSDVSHILSHAVKIPGLIFVSGQVPKNIDAQVVPGGIKEHTAQCILNVSNVLEAAGSTLDKVVKFNIYLKDIGDFDAVNEAYEKLVPSPKPARTCIQAAGLPGDVDIEIEAIAVA